MWRVWLAKNRTQTIQDFIDDYVDETICCQTRRQTHLKDQFTRVYGVVWLIVETSSRRWIDPMDWLQTRSETRKAVSAKIDENKIVCMSLLLQFLPYTIVPCIGTALRSVDLSTNKSFSLWIIVDYYECSRQLGLIDDKFWRNRHVCMMRHFTE